MFFFKLDRDYREALSFAGTIGLHMVSAIFVGGGLGWVVDRYVTGSYPTATRIGFVLGVVAAFKMVYQDASRLKKRMESDGTGGPENADDVKKTNDSKES